MKDITILFVDDEEHILKSLERSLLKEPYKKLFTSSGPEALEIMGQESVQVIVCDMKMPEMDGLTLLQTVKEKFPDTIRMVLSGFTHISQIIPCINTGEIFRYITKPLEPAEFKNVLRDAVEQYLLRLDKEELIQRLARRNEELEEALKARQIAEADRERLFNYSIDMLCIAGFDGFFKQLNPAWEKTLGWSESELQAKPWLDFVHPEDHELTLAAAADLKAGNPVYGFENRYLHKDGAWHVIAWNSFPLVDEKLIFCVARDVTEQHKLEELREDIERITRHDLKTPLNCVIGMSTLLKRELDLNEHYKSILAMVEDAGYKMLYMINSSLDLYKMEKGTYKFQPYPFDINSVLHSINNELQEIIERKQVRLNTFIGKTPLTPDTIFELEGDKLLCYTMLANLIMNAVEASPENEDITVVLGSTDEHYIIKIWNYGCVPEEIKDHFFEKYATSGKKTGTGLGTYSAKLITKTHGGTITLDTSNSKGTLIIIELPKHLG